MPAIALLAGPGILLYQVAAGRVTDGVAIAVMSTITIGLFLARLVGVVTAHRQSQRRELNLRNTYAALVAATDPAEIDTILRDAAEGLIPAGTPHQVLVIRRGEASSIDQQTADELARRDGVLLRSIAELPMPLRAQFAGFPLALVCRMSAGHRDGDDPNVDSGTLVIAAAEIALVNIQGIAEVLAGQAALALERIRLALEINRRASEEYFRTLVQNTADVILILNEQHRVQYASPSATRMFAGGVTGMRLFDLVDPADALRAADVLDTLQPGESHDAGTDWRLPNPGGTALQVSASLRDLRHDPTVRGLVVTFRDVTERRRLERDLTHQAFHDGLTGLANRVLLTERLQHAVTRAGRSGALTGVVVLNLDGFTAVNNASDHATGDRLLSMVAQRLRAVLRAADTAARLSGDEFAILAEDLSSPVELIAMVPRIVEVFAEPFDLGERSVQVSAGIGVSCSTDADSAADLLRQANLALHVAKRAGPAQWRRFEPSQHIELLQQQELRADLEHAVIAGQFTVYYQPIVAIGTGATVGMEALVRWQHPDRGMIRPDLFIPLAEETGLIVPLGLHVLERSLAAVAQWRQHRPESPPYVSVNVSARQLRTTGFVAEVLDRLTAAGLPPTALLIEVTESMLVRDGDQAWEHLAVLRGHGVRVAIDDFGTGYSSLNYLRQDQCDVVKIDKSFVDGLGHCAPHQYALVDGIVRMATTLGLAVVAEGIEHETDRAVLHQMGCPYGQGYLFAKPMPAGDAQQWFKTTTTAP